MGGHQLDHEYLHYMLEMAGKLKAVAVLEALLDLSVLLQLEPQEKASIYNELIKIHGKLENAENLEKVLDLVLLEKEREHFRQCLARLAHFYK
ncbi:hypothetical protein OESDEN_18587 [Oesophagostomum dentatum]|uniref:Uncharacterized protein n=1 Tax=Oesophagostomum dentatum TaxID=61180 RepID=A0A0B1SEW1_OESDE|nr:hypothetical protein OESDEN_18587 [Oesophagostomum dentatum]